MRKLAKKAFTLVELLVVIAIVAILAVVGIVSYAVFTKKANVSNDISLVAELNTVLQAAEAGGKKNATFHEAREDALEVGFDLANLKISTKDYRIAWDYTNDRVILLDGDNILVAPEGYECEKKNMFLVAKTAADVNDKNDYNYYLADNFPATEVKAKTGVDVGNNANIKLTYTDTEEESKMFRTTDGCEFTINNQNADIQHYGVAKEVIVTAVKDASYHCFANVTGDIKVTKGRVVVESGASVAAINVTSANVKIEVKNGQKNIPVIAEGGVDLSGKVDGATTVTVGDDEVYSSETGAHKTLLEALKHAKDGETITVLKELSNEELGEMSKTNGFPNVSVTVNLNGKTLTVESMATDASGIKKITFKNGTFNTSLIGQSVVSIGVMENTTLELEDIKGKAELYNGGQTATLNVRNCELTAQDFVIGTNANEKYNGAGVVINIENSTLEGLCPICLTVPGTVNIKGSKFIGYLQGSFFRNGNIKIENSEFALKKDAQKVTYGEYANADNFKNKIWASGDCVNAAALTIGNKTAGSYPYSVTVDLKNVKFTEEGFGKNFPSVYAWASKVQGQGVILTFDDKCSFSNGIVVGGDVPTKAYDGTTDLSDTTKAMYDNGADNASINGHKLTPGKNYKGTEKDIT